MLDNFDLNRWQFSVSNFTQPVAACGTAVTPTTSNGDPSTWTEILSDTVVTNDCYLISININTHNTTATVRNLLVDIGIDTSGGTSYTTLIPSLIGGHASSFATGAAADGGHQYWFPLYIPAGTAIAARGRGSNASAITFNIAITLFGRPSHPHMIKYGSRVEAIGVTTADSSGTTFVSGTTSEGSWTSLGASSNANFFWQVGYTATNTNQPNNSRLLDLAYDNNATTPNIIMQDIFCASSTAERNSIENRPDSYCHVPSGSTIYVRGQESSTPVATQKAACWGVS
jgi:hypothetical protein